MQIRLVDFSGAFIWLVLGDQLLVDKAHADFAEMLRTRQNEVVRLSSYFQNSPINPHTQKNLLKELLLRSNNKYEQLYISDTAGNYFNADGQTNNIADRRYFQQVMQGQTVISEPIINRSTGRPVIAVATPLWQEGKVAGLFGATILIGAEYCGNRSLAVLRARTGVAAARTKAQFNGTTGALTQKRDVA